MTLIRNKALVLIMAVMATIVLIMSTPSQASSINVAIHNQGDSGAHLDVLMVNNVSGRSYEINLQPGATAGEPNYLYSDAEPVAFYHRAGWCTKYWTNDGAIHYLYAQSTGYWWDVYVSTSAQNSLERVKTWNC